PGPRRCAWTANWPAVSPPRCATDCCTSPPGWCAPAAAGSSRSTKTGPGPPTWPPRSPGSALHPGQPDTTTATIPDPGPSEKPEPTGDTVLPSQRHQPPEDQLLAGLINSRPGMKGRG